MRNKLPLLLGLLSAGCVTQAATFGSVPKERATECVSHCEALGMKLSAVVIIRSSAGCVCEPTGADSRATGSVAAAAGGALIADEEEEQQRASTSGRR
jgi:hypothetical protein